MASFGLLTHVSYFCIALHGNSAALKALWDNRPSVPVARLPRYQQLAPIEVVPERTEPLRTLGKKLVEVRFNQTMGVRLVFRL